MLMFGILELGLVFLTDSVLDTAVMQASRTIRTGEAQGAKVTGAAFKSQLCAKMTVFASECPSRVTVDVREVSQFRNVNPPDPLLDGKTFNTNGLTYATGQPGSLMLIRVWYSRPLIAPLLKDSMSRLKDGNVIITSTATFRNEPYTS